MIWKLLPLIIIFQLSSCNEESQTTTTTTPRPPYAINTTSGDLGGFNLTFPEGNVTEYLGVPYAYPPVSGRRFYPPEELKEPAWNGTRHAIVIAKDCVQPLIKDGFEGFNYSNPRGNVTEDCLELNMWVPGNRSGSTIVFLSGENFIYGSPSLDFNNGSMLALKSKAIVINVGYRLGIFGFAYFGEDSDVKGNMGLLDQQVALKWIYKNIEKFGGNKSMITLYGSGAGAASVTAHLFSQNSTNLFNRAVGVSGVITALGLTIPSFLAKNLTLTVAQMLNCYNESEVFKTITCLQNKSAKDIMIVSRGLYNLTYLKSFNATFAENFNKTLKRPVPLPFVPINNDTVFFNGSLYQKINKNDLKNNSDFVFGRTQDEYTYLMPFTLQHLNCTFNSSIDSNAKPNRCLLANSSLEAVANVTARILRLNESFTEKLVEIYNETKTNKTRGKVAELMSDFYIDCKLSTFAEYYYNASKNMNVSVYFFEFRKRSFINPWPKWMGAMHGWELEYVYGYPFRHPELYLNKTTNSTQNTTEVLMAEQNFSSIVIRHVANFSETGRPGDAWLKYNDTSKLALVISGNLSEVKYVNASSPRCIKFEQLYKNFTEDMKQNKSISE